MKFLIISSSSLISFLCGLAAHVSLLFVEGMWHHSHKLVSQGDNAMLLKWVTAHRTGETEGYWRGADWKERRDGESCKMQTQEWVTNHTHERNAICLDCNGVVCKLVHITYPVYAKGFEYSFFSFWHFYIIA